MGKKAKIQDYWLYRKVETEEESNLKIIYSMVVLTNEEPGKRTSKISAAHIQSTFSGAVQYAKGFAEASGSRGVEVLCSGHKERIIII